MQRYFVAPQQFEDDVIRLDGEEAHHMIKVMRMKVDEHIVICDGDSRTVLAAISKMDGQQVEATIIEDLPQLSEPAWSITIAQSLPKGDKLELVIQKGTEIGATGFIPFESKRNVVQYDRKKELKKLERWNKIAKEAAEQAHRHRMPSVASIHSWRELLTTMNSYDLTLFCYEQEGHAAHGVGIGHAVQHWRTSLKANSAEQTVDRTPSILLVVGPEGGFTEQEAAEAKEAGAVHVALGRRILRTETAGIVGLTCLLYESGEMGGN